MIALLTDKKVTPTHLILVCVVAFLVRALTFSLYVQHEERYCQSDSVDYHLCGLTMSRGNGMYYPGAHRYIFWRTPGYPLYLAPFYAFYSSTATSGAFSDHAAAQKAAIWVQIALCSLLPLLVFWLSLTLTCLPQFSWYMALISALHPGFVLASTYLLTDGLAQLFFILFLIFYYRSFTLSGAEKLRTRSPFFSLATAACFLSLYTWMRPMGQFVALAAALLLLFDQQPLKKRLAKIALFLGLFIATIAPWCIRNYKLTKSPFFCPLFGLYFNVFNAPKIRARVENIPLIKAHSLQLQEAGKKCAEKIREYALKGDTHVVCGEVVSMESAWPWLRNYPGYFMYDWAVEVAKTTFDLYASQLVAFAGNCYKWDELVEYLPTKLANCLYAHPLPWFMRLLAWLEFIFYSLLWLGIVAGIYTFMLGTIRFPHDTTKRLFALLWLKGGYLVAAAVCQTGGFGYARLRLPIEPLLLIVGCLFWWWFLTRGTKAHGISVCTVESSVRD